MTYPDPLRHLTRAAELATVADRKITDGIYSGGDTEFTQTVIDLGRLHVQIANAAATLVPVCRYGPDVRHAPHDGCEGTLGMACGATLPHAPHGACGGRRDPLAEQQKRGEL